MQTKKGIIAFAYLRESLEDRDSKNKSEDDVTTSIKNQEVGAIKEAKSDGITLSKTNIFKDLNVTSTDSERKGFNELFSKVKGCLQSHEVRIYIKDYYRLGRGITFFTLRNRLTDIGVPKENILFYLEHFWKVLDDSNQFTKRVNSEDDSIIMMKMGMSYSQIEKNRRDTIRLHKDKSEAGLPYIRAPFGYRYNGEFWIVDKRRSEIVKEVFKQTLTSRNYKDIISDLKISKTLYYKILHNKSYIGVICHKKYHKNSEGKIVRIEPIEYRGKQPEIISEELFNKVQQKIRRK